MKEGIKYSATHYSGLICPIDNVAQMEEQLQAAVDEFQAHELKTRSRKDLIWGALADYECQISYDPRDAVDALASYGITEKEVAAEWGAYMKHCRDNDLF